MSKQVKRLYEFGPFRIDTQNRLLMRDGKPIPLKPKVVDTLLLLIENSGQVLEKDEIIEALWPDSFVEEGNLTQNIYVLRKALAGGAEAESESYIETIPRRGYRFTGQVKEIRDETGETPAEVVATSTQQSQRDPTPPVSLVSAKKPHFRRWPLIAGLVGLGLVVAIAVYWMANRTKRAAPGIKSLAILPFKPLNSEATDEYMGQGIADALIAKLSSSRQITVRPTSLVLKYGAAGQDPLTAGRALDVEAVLDGTIQRAGDRVRVSVQLLRVADGASLWSAKFDEKFTDIFAMQDSISDQVARWLALQLSANELTRKDYTKNAEAYQAYLQGRYFWNKRNAAGFRKGIDHFRQAIEIDSNYALAYAGLADCYIRLNESGVPTAQEAVPRGREAVMRALAIDDNLAEAHATLGFIKFRHDWDFAGADQEFKRALQLDENYSEAHQWYAFYLLAAGRPEEAEAQMKRAQELDPVSIGFNSNLALFLFFRHKFDESVKQSQKTLEMEPDIVVARVTLALSYEQQGLGDAAIAELRKAQERAPTDAGTMAALGHALAKKGQVQEARLLLRSLLQRAKENYAPPYGLAVLHAGLGEKAQAFEALERAFQDRSLRPVWLKYDPRLDGLRQQREFADLAQRIGLTP